MPKKSRKNVGLIGLGIIGSRVANALRLGGFHVYVWNRTPRAAPNFLASPAQVAELCDVIQIFVSDAQALFNVLDGMGDALTASHVIVCNSTVGPEATIDAARLVQERGAQFLDAPFSGSKVAAEKRELVYYIGGEDKALKAAEPILKVSSKAIVKIGKVGDAAVVKVATNMLAAVTVQTLAEAYSIVKGSGIAPRALADALEHHGVRSGVTDAKLPKILDRDYETHFSLKNMFKDVQLGIHIANSLDIDLPATTSTAGVMYGGLTRGWADEDFSVLARSYQKEDQPAPLYAAPPTTTSEKTPDAPATTPPEKPAEGPAALPPLAEKKEAAREATADELRDVGIKLPAEPPPPVAPAEPAAPAAEKTAPPAPEDLAKPEPAKTARQPATDASTGAPKAEAGAPKAEAGAPKAEAGAPKADDGVQKAAIETPKAEAQSPNAEAPEEKSSIANHGENSGGKPPEPSPGTNGVPGEPSRTHTPFVRIRRWFGTGTPS